MNGYKAFLNGRVVDVYADSAYAAKLKAIVLLKARRFQEHLVSVVLCEKDGQTVTHSTAEFG